MTKCVICGHYYGEDMFVNDMAQPTCNDCIEGEKCQHCGFKTEKAICPNCGKWTVDEGPDTFEDQE